MRSPWSAGVRECGTTKSRQRAARKSCSDYHLRVGQLTQDTRLPGGYALHEQRLDRPSSASAHGDPDRRQTAAGMG